MVPSILRYVPMVPSILRYVPMVPSILRYVPMVPSNVLSIRVESISVKMNYKITLIIKP